MSEALAKRAPQGNGVLATQGSMTPNDIAAAFAESGMFPDVKSQAQALVKIVAGQEMGIGPMAAMMGINIISGKVTLSANLLAAQVKSHPVYDFLPREHTADVCRIEFFQNGDSVGVSDFSIQDAKRAGVGGGQNYRRYPKAMLFARALTQGVRWFCPDVTAGSPAYVPEELGAEVGEDGAPLALAAPVAVAPEPVPASPPPGAISKAKAARLFEGAKTAGLDGQKVSLWLTGNGVEHGEIRNKGTAVEALRLLSEPLAAEFVSHISAALDAAGNGGSE